MASCMDMIPKNSATRGPPMTDSASMIARSISRSRGSAAPIRARVARSSPISASAPTMRKRTLRSDSSFSRFANASTAGTWRNIASRSAASIRRSTSGCPSEAINSSGGSAYTLIFCEIRVPNSRLAWASHFFRSPHTVHDHRQNRPPKLT